MDELEKKLLEKAIRRRDLLVRSIQRVCTNIENMEVDEDDPKAALEAAKIDKADLEKKMVEFHEIQSQVEMDVGDDQLELHEDERTRVETIARSAKIVLADFIAAHSSESVNSNPGSRRTSTADTRTDRKIKRPEIQIPKFDGDYRKWSEFRNVFESLVVSDDAYTNVEKMVYLKQAMQKNAADVIRKFEISEHNFGKAWEKLRKRYENRRATINTHLQSLTQLPSAKAECGVQKLLDAATDAIESLDAMGVKNGWSYMLAYLVTERLDVDTRKAWEIETVKEPEYPSFEMLESFLQQRIRVIESMGTSAGKPATTSQATTRKNEAPAKSFALRRTSETSAAHAVTERKCYDCAESHPIAECEKFAARTLNEKVEVINRKGLCFQCLCKGHIVLSCRAPRCSKCGKRHHILLHVENMSTDEKKVDEKVEAKKSYCTLAEIGTVVLPTALVIACQGENESMTRTFLDSCSQPNLVSESLVKKLKCRKRESSVSIVSVTPGTLDVKRSCRLRIRSRYRKFSVEADFQITPAIAEDFRVYDTSRIKRNLEFADSEKLGGSRVDMLIGAELYETLMMSGKIKIEGEPYLRETVFGWIAIGSIGGVMAPDSTICCLTIQDQLQQFFVVEELVTSSVERWTVEEETCNEHFEANYGRKGGRFEVALPVSQSVGILGESRHIAFRQFCALERKLSMSEFEVYREFMNEYIQLGHMSLVVDLDLSEFRCYLPHHAVYKKSSTTTRMRSVFNASCPTSTGCSLNDVLLKGPVLQDELFVIMLRFRCKRVAVTADIEKMYRQVVVRKEDRHLQCILWRDSVSESVRTYELNTVTYGTKPASYLATKCLRILADQCDSELTETATVLRSDFYMDDMLAGGSSDEEVRERLQELRQVLGEAGFPLRKFASNSEIVLSGLDRDLVEGAIEFDNEEMSVGVLGLRWVTSEDRFVFYAKLPREPSRWTKREILSEVSRIFDPLGLLAPLVVSLKMLLQRLWADKLGWDDVVPEGLMNRYAAFRSRLTELPSIIIPRFVGGVEGNEIHVFCDASEKAYGAAVYVRRKWNEEYVVRLLCAKTRVAPVRAISLPRLELCATLLAAKLLDKVKSALKVKEGCKIRAWSDSTIVLSWLAKPQHPWCAFVANRVTKISEIVPASNWKHVKSQDNAADIISRGIEPAQMGEIREFLIGPEFLRSGELTEHEVEFNDDALMEQRNCAKVLLATTGKWSIKYLEKFSNYLRLIRVTAYVVRFAENSAVEAECRNFGSLTVNECRNALNIVIKLSQSLIEPKRLTKIDHFIDPEGVIRLRSRLSNSELSEKIKYPVVLPKCKLLYILIEYLHYKFYHANYLFVKHILDFEYFALTSLSKAVRSVVYKCVVCRRHAPKGCLEFKFTPGQLPAARVNSSPAFVEVGVDFAGPVNTRAVGPGGNRGKVFFKSYIAVFVCMSTKACHLEVVEDLSTKAFLDCFSRFMSRRGVCANVYSDHGSNFVGADRELKAAYEMVWRSRKDIDEFAVTNGINWNFIPQRAPNFGGLWEAAVKSFKSHFRKVVGSQVLSFVELSTLTTQIEAILNSRPLCAGGSVDSSFISPSHLCIGRSLVLLPEIRGEVVTGSPLARYRLLRGLLERFWIVWRNDYLVSLRKANLRVVSNRLPVLGELVLVKDEAGPPCSWPMGRIVKLFPGKDGIVRVVDVQLGSKIFRRPLIKLVPLLIEPLVAQGGEYVEAS